MVSAKIATLYEAQGALQLESPMCIPHANRWWDILPSLRSFSQLWIEDHDRCWRVMISMDKNNAPFFGADFRKQASGTQTIDAVRGVWCWNSVGWVLVGPLESKEILKQIEEVINLAIEFCAKQKVKR